MTLYYSFIFPYLLYCIEIWGSTNITLFQAVFKLQKRAVRIIVSANFKAHTDPVFQRLEILPLKKNYHFSLILLMFKYTHNLLPDIFEKYLLETLVYTSITQDKQLKSMYQNVILVLCSNLSLLKV